MLLAEYIGSFGIEGKGFVESFNLFQFMVLLTADGKVDL